VYLTFEALRKAWMEDLEGAADISLALLESKIDIRQQLLGVGAVTPSEGNSRSYRNPSFANACGYGLYGGSRNAFVDLVGPVPVQVLDRSDNHELIAAHSCEVLPKQSLDPIRICDQ